MAKSLLEALKEKGLVDPKAAERVEQERLKKLKVTEELSDIRVRARGYSDQEQLIRDERYHRGAAKEGRNSASRVGSRAYFDRFKK